jgi:hypothetical protein
MDGGRLKTNAYDLGQSANWRQIFGHKVGLWFMPVITAIGDGIEWEINVDESALGLPLNRPTEEEEDGEEESVHRNRRGDNMV